MNTIVLNYDPFVMNCKAYIFVDGKQDYFELPSDIMSISKQLVELAYSLNVYEIKLNSDMVLEELSLRVKQEESKQYNENKINIERL